MRRRILAALVGMTLAPSGAFAEATSTQSSVQNSNSPTGVVNQQTGGGINLNQQYNNQWDNHNGFGVGVYCRTPTFYLGSGYGQANSYGDNEGIPSLTTGHAQVAAGLLVPFGSSVLKDCAEMAKALTQRAIVANDVALIRACHDLKKSGIVIDPVKFPTLARCTDNEFTLGPVGVK